MSSSSSSKFSRFGDKRKVGSDTTGYDDYVEGVEAEETSSLEQPLKEDNRGFKLIQKMGWHYGTGLGKFKQGRVDPVPFEQKDDHMGLGRWTMELEVAQDATEKRRQLESEKELTADLMEQYRVQAEKEQKICEILTEMNKAFYCELCDRQYTKYSEFDNHINSYSHHHQQRLRDLKQYETGRKFGGHRNTDEDKEKMMAAQMVALERAQMKARQERWKSKRGEKPAFKPIGEGSGRTMGGATPGDTTREERSKDTAKSQEKIAEKKMKLTKFGLNFQSAGTLMTIHDQIGKDTPLCVGGGATSLTQVPGGSEESRKRSKDSYVEEMKGAYTTKWSKEGSHSTAEVTAPLPSSDKAPPPLMSRQRELTMEKYDDKTSDDEDISLTARTLIKKKPTFKFNIGKK